MNHSTTSRSPEHWAIWKVLNNYEQTTKDIDCSAKVKQQVREVLYSWATINDQDSYTAFHSLLQKRSLLHEIQECLPALQYLSDWRQTTPVTSFRVIDVCGGKGVLTCLLRYMVARFWNRDVFANVQSIVLLERAVGINWDHLLKDESNPIPVEIWRECDLHQLDARVEQCQELDGPLALIGIHLCKTLGTDFVSLCNLLGPKKVPFATLVPCCMPRAVRRNPKTKSGNESHMARPSFVEIHRYESQVDRTSRLESLRLKKAARSGYGCWSCGSLDHQRSACVTPNPGIFCSPTTPPIQQLDVTNILNVDNPLQTVRRTQQSAFAVISLTLYDVQYAELIWSGLDGNWTQFIRHAGLTNTNTGHHGNDWNAVRKTLYLVAHIE